MWAETDPVGGTGTVVHRLRTAVIGGHHPCGEVIEESGDLHQNIMPSHADQPMGIGCRTSQREGRRLDEQIFCCVATVA